jgi:arylformamidase
MQGRLFHVLKIPRIPLPCRNMNVEASLTLTCAGKARTARLLAGDGVDISIPVEAGGGAAAWYVPPVRMEPVRAAGFVGSVAEGGSVNFRSITFNPHGHGTHTECSGHITREITSVLDEPPPAWMACALLTITPETLPNGDLVITAAQLALAHPAHSARDIPALAIRTLPNDAGKRTRNWSNTNPPYLLREAAEWLVEHGVRHLLIDLPSVDAEEDGGALEAHHAFFKPGNSDRRGATITEFIFVDDATSDGLYALNLQLAAFVNDAAPSRPLLFPFAS